MPLLDHCLRFALLALALLVGAPAAAAPADYNVGAFYFPGWKNDEPGAPSKRPWDPIKKFPQKEPLIGWYDEGQPDVVAKQLAQMRAAGLNFIVFDWYWSEGKAEYLGHTIKAFRNAPEWPGMKFALLWANHMKVPNTRANFEAMIAHLSRNYLSQPDHLRIDGKPALFIFSQQNLRDRAREMGLEARDLIRRAREIAREQGVGEIYIVGSAEAVRYWVTEYGLQSGYDAYSAYNYHRGFEGTFIPLRPLSHSFEELSDAYSMTWNWMMKNSPLPYIVPGTAGWNKRPWGGSIDPWHDDSEASPAEFEAHLRRIKVVLDAHPEKTHRTAVLCCWNEHGEGSVIEPTKEWGNTRVDAIRKVFRGQ
jgi:Glycosyltransferase WbsX